MAPRPKKEYEEREADDSGTPFQRFTRALQHAIAIPKAELDKRERDRKKRREGL